MLSADSTILFAPEDDDEPVTIYSPDKKRIREQLERTERLEKENRELKEKLRRAPEDKGLRPLPRGHRTDG